MSTRNETGLLIGRVLLGLVFLAFAYYKLTAMDVWGDEVKRLGFPAPGAMAWLIAVVELVGGLMLVLGIKARIAACALAVFLFGATIMHFRDYVKTDAAFQITNILKNLGILGGLAAVWAVPTERANLLR